MIVSTVCPSCGHKYDIAFRLFGRKVRCKSCSSIFRVPVPAHVPPSQHSSLSLEEIVEDDEFISGLDEAVAEVQGNAASPTPDSGVATVLLWSVLGLVSLAILWKAGFGQPRWLAVTGCVLTAATMLYVRFRVRSPDRIAADRRSSAATVAGGFVAVAAVMVGILILMDVIHFAPRGVPPTLSVAASRTARQEALREKYPGKAVTVLVKGFPQDPDLTEKAEEILGDRIRELATDAEIAPGGEGGERSFTLAPVEDPDAILKGIDFGQTGRRGVLIDVDLSPAYVASLTEAATEAPLIAGSDDIEIAVRDLQRDDRSRQKSAATRLISLPQDDARKRTVVAALVPLLDSGDDPTAVEAVKALSAWKTKEALAVLIDQLKDPRTEVRHLVMKGLVRSGDPKAMQAVLSRLKDEPEAVESALLEVGAAAEPSIFPRLADPDPSQRRKACELLAQLGGPASIEAIQASLSDRDESVRAQAAIALKAIQERVAIAKARK